MKSKKGLIRIFAISAICLIAMSGYAPRPGGDSFTIYFNDKLLVKHFVLSKDETPTVSLPNITSNDVMRVHYSHCGKIGTARNLTIKDSQDRIVKSGKFKDSQDDNGQMILPSADLLSLQKLSTTKFTLSYSANELTKEKTLAVIETGESKASLH